MTTIIEYLRCKYKTDKPTAILKTEAKAFGMPYPLRSGWLIEFGGMEITPGMLHRLRDGLTRRGWLYPVLLVLLAHLSVTSEHWQSGPPPETESRPMPLDGLHK